MDFEAAGQFALLLVRPGMVVALSPGLGGAHIAAPVKIGLIVLIALGLMPSVVVSPTAGETALALIIAREMAIGLAIAFVMRVLIAGAELAGYLSGAQIGFSYGATIDPASGVRSTMLATLYGSLATLTFLAVNGHHAVLRALSASYAGLPIGGGQINASLVGSVQQVLGLVFVIGARLAAPIVIVLLIVELAVGLISRTQPALNFMVIGYPLRLAIGLLLLAVLVPTVPAVTSSLVDTVVRAAAGTATAFR
jgi:flagellar biosynthetic protein FliR